MKAEDEAETVLPANLFSTSLFEPILSSFSSDLSLYDQIMNQIDPARFASLHKKEKGSVAGLSFLDGGIYEQKLSIAGRTSVKTDLITKNLAIAGSARIKGMVASSEKSSIAGSITIDENALFGGPLSIGGRLSVGGNLVLSGGLRLGGRVTVNDYVVADSPLKINGTLITKSIRTNDLLELKGKISVQEDVIAKTIELKDGSGIIEGNLYASDIKLIRDESTGKDLTSALGLFSYIKDVLIRTIRGMSSSNLQVNGHVIADHVTLDNITIGGDLYIKSGKLGPNTRIKGTVYYLDSLESETANHIQSQKGFPETLADPSMK